MKITLCIVPPGGGEIDYSLPMEVPAIPNAGDYISVTREGSSGTEDFIVRRTWWHLSFSEGQQSGGAKAISIECEVAKGPMSSEAHLRVCDQYHAKTGKLLTLDSSMY